MATAVLKPKQTQSKRRQRGKRPARSFIESLEPRRLLSSAAIKIPIIHVVLPPEISGVSPTSIVASDAMQSIIVDGSDFESGTEVSLTDPQGATIADKVIILSTQFTLQFNDNFDLGMWRVTAVNPGNINAVTGSFNVQAAPLAEVSSVSPSSMIASNKSQTITVDGANFEDGTSVTLVNPIGATIAGTLKILSSTQFTYQFNDDYTLGTWDVKVSNPTSNQQVTGTFNVSPTTAPSISSVSPASMPASFQPRTITIKGSHFQRDTELALINPDSDPVAGTLHFVSSTELTYQFTNDVGGTWTVQLTNPGSETASDTFSVIAAPLPTISSVSPSPMASSTELQKITIDGTNFASDTEFALTDPQGNSVSGKLTLVSPTQFTYQFANNDDLGTWKVNLTNPASDTASGPFNVLARPMPLLNGVTPVSEGASSKGETVTIDGANFDKYTVFSVVNPNGQTVSGVKLTIVSASKVTIQVGNTDVPGNWTVEATNPGSDTSNITFAITPSPTATISSVSPTSLIASGGNDTITVFGTNFNKQTVFTLLDPQGDTISATIDVLSGSKATLRFNDASDMGTWKVGASNPGSGQIVTGTFNVNPTS